MCDVTLNIQHPGKSLYFTIVEFLLISGSVFAHIQWLSEPEYPFAPNRLVVVVTLGSPCLQRKYGDLLRIEDIEPTTVFVDPHENGTHFYLMRETGYDRSHVPLYE